MWPQNRDPHALQRAYWASLDRAHFDWQTGNPYIAAPERELLDALVVQPGDSVLEVGCGEGANLRNLAPRLAGAAVFAVDFSLPKAAFAAAEGRPTACADATRLPFRDSAFDAVLVRDLLHHVPARSQVLSEIARVLKPGGRFAVIEPNGRNPIIAAMAMLIPAERGMLASRPARALEEARAVGLAGLRIEERQPMPLSRVLLHYRLGLPGLARFAAARAVLRALERAAQWLPRSLWSYFVLSGERPTQPR